MELILVKLFTKMEKQLSNDIDNQDITPKITVFDMRLRDIENELQAINLNYENISFEIEDLQNTLEDLALELNNAIIELNNSIITINSRLDDKTNINSNNNNLDLNIKASFKGRGIKNFPIKFSSGYNHYVERVLCGSDGYCKVNLKVEKIVNKNNDILITAVVDLQTLEKHFNHSLKKNLFGRLELLSITFKLKRESQVVQSVFKQRKQNIKQNRKLTPWEKCCANDIDLSPLRYGSKLGYNRHNQRNGHINFRYRFGNGSNINIHKGW